MTNCFESGLRDLIKDTVLNSKDEDLNGAKVIWGEGNYYRYRAHLICYPHHVPC